MFTPKIVYIYSQRTGEFFDQFPSDRKSKETDFIITSLPVEDHIYDGINGGRRVWAAVRVDGTWAVEQMILNHSAGFLSIQCVVPKPLDAYAYPIDPRMTREDIEGATRIYANADNTGWLFAHANHGHHHDHEINLMAGIDGIFQPVFRQYNVDHITGANDAAKLRAANQYKLLSQFYGEVVGLARTNARAKHLGERHKDPHPENGHIHSEIKVAYEATNTKWKASKQKTELALIAGAFTYIETALTIPTPETRWDKAARLEAEAKKKKAAAEAETSTQTPTESSGQ